MCFLDRRIENLAGVRTGHIVSMRALPLYIENSLRGIPLINAF